MIKIFIFLFMMLFSSKIFGGYTFELITIYNEDFIENKTTYYLENNIFRSENEEEIIQIDFNQNNISIYLKNEGIFTRLTLTEYYDILNKIKENYKKLFPPEQRLKLEKLIISSTNKSTKFIVKQATSENISGYNTEKYDIYLNNELIEELWITTNTGMEREKFYNKAQNHINQEIMSLMFINYGNNQLYDKIIKKGVIIKRKLNIAGINTIIETKNIIKKNLKNELKLPNNYSYISANKYFEYLNNLISENKTREE